MAVRDGGEPVTRGKEKRAHGRERGSSTAERLPRLRLHTLFLLLGVWYALTGELFLFLLSALVALQHECAHAFAAAKLGYRLDKIVLMPFGAVIDGDLSCLRLKDEIWVAICGPLCNLLTALFFVAIWWLMPTMYAFTDTACYASLAIGVLNLLPAYPLDGGRIAKCLLLRLFLRGSPDADRAQRRADAVCLAITLLSGGFFLVAFLRSALCGAVNPSLLAFGVFLLVGGFGNGKDGANYARLDFSRKDAIKDGVEIKRVAVTEHSSVKNALRFIGKDKYLLLDVYDKRERRLFTLTQNQLSSLFLHCKTPYEPIGRLYREFYEDFRKKSAFSHENEKIPSK